MRKIGIEIDKIFPQINAVYEKAENIASNF